MTTPSPANVAGQRDPYAPTIADNKRSQEMHRAWNAYEGCFQGGEPQWPLLWKEGKEPNPNVIINRCGPAVDTDVAWLMGESVGISLPKTAPKAAQAYVDQAWGVTSDDSSDDDKMSLLQELATNGAVTGHAFIKMVWEEDGQTGKPLQEFPELVVLDSEFVRVQTAPHNVKVPICYIIEYRIPDPGSQDGATGTFRQVIELNDKDGVQKVTGKPDPDDYWTIQDYFRGSRTQTYVAQGAPRKWPYPWAPIDGCPHIAQPKRYYGRPRITRDAIHINEAICMVASNINKIGIRHGAPVLYTIKQGNNQKTLRHEPGTILEVSSDIKAVEAHGDLANLMEFEQDLHADFDGLTHIQAQSFGRQEVPRSPVSGVAIRLQKGDLLSDITKEQRTYGALIRRVTQHMLELKNAAWASLSVELGWQDPLPADDLQQAQVIQAYDAMGIISKKTAADKAGLDWEVEQANMQDEAQDAMTAALQGKAWPDASMPPTTPPPPVGASDQPGQPPNGQPGQSGAPQQPPQQNMPPVNHPKVVQQRAATAAVAKVMKAGAQ